MCESKVTHGVIKLLQGCRQEEKSEGSLVFRQNSSFCPSISGDAALKPRIAASAGVFAHTHTHRTGQAVMENARFLH